MLRSVNKEIEIKQEFHEKKYYSVLVQTFSSFYHWYEIWL